MMLAKTLLALLMLCAAWPTWAAEAKQPTAMLAAARAMPDVVQRLGRVGRIVFADYRAAERIAGIATTPGPDLAGLDAAGFERWAAALSRLQVEPLELTQALERMRRGRAGPVPAGGLSLFDGLPAVLGIDWSEVNQALAMLRPSEAIPARQAFVASPAVVLAGKPGFAPIEALQEALLGQGYQRRDTLAGPVWHRFPNFKVRPDKAAPADALGAPWNDPLGVRAGAAGRIGKLPGLVIGSGGWTSFEAMLASSLKLVPPLDQAADFGALARALDPHGSTLVQAMFFDHRRFSALDLAYGRLGEETPATRIKTYAKTLEGRATGRLELAQLAALGDRRLGGDDVIEIALVYPQAKSAEAVAALLVERLADYRPRDGEATLTARFGLRIDHRLVRQAKTERHVAVVSLTRPAPEPSYPSSAGQLYRLIMQGLVLPDAEYLFVQTDD